MSEQNGNDGEHYGEPLTWPIAEELIGRKVRFDGYVRGIHSHWDFVVGKEYLIANVHGVIGPVNIRGNSLPKNFGDDFKFTLLSEREIPVGYYYDDEEDKLKPLKNETFVRYDVSNAVFKIPASEEVKLQPHHQTGENGNMPAIPIEFSGFGQYAYAGLTKREIFAMHAMHGMLSHHGGRMSLLCWIAENSVSYADALLAKLEKQENNQ